MANRNVFHCYGTKKAYLSMKNHDSNTMYYLIDAGEIRLGDTVLSRAVEIVDNYDSLPQFSKAAAFTLYICRDTGNGYVLNHTADGFDMVLYGIDNETIENINNKADLAEDYAKRAESAEQESALNAQASEDAANRAEVALTHQPYPSKDTETWWLWNAINAEYEDSGISCLGNFSYPIFSVDDCGYLCVEYPDKYSGPLFRLNESGELEVHYE